MILCDFCGVIDGVSVHLYVIFYRLGYDVETEKVWMCGKCKTESIADVLAKKMKNPRVIDAGRSK